jgi:hypothetical protein
MVICCMRTIITPFLLISILTLIVTVSVNSDHLQTHYRMPFHPWSNLELSYYFHWKLRQHVTTLLPQDPSPSTFHWNSIHLPFSLIMHPILLFLQHETISDKFCQKIDLDS